MNERDPRLTFFPDRRVKVELSGWQPKMNAQGEKRVRLDFMLPLLDDTRKGMVPHWMIYPLDAMDRADSAEDKVGFGKMSLEGVTLEFWDAPKSPERKQLIASATLQDFSLERVTRDKQTFIALCFSANVKRCTRWCEQYEACYVFAAFTPADPAAPSKGDQMSIGDVKSGKDKAANQGDEEREEMPNLDSERRTAAEAGDSKSKKPRAN